MKRRDFLRHTACSVLAACTAGPLSPRRESYGADAAAVPSLREYAARVGLLYGSPIFPQDLKNPDVMAFIAQQCSLVDFVIYFNTVQPHQGQFNFKTPDAVRDFAKMHGIKLRGHPVIGNGGVPAWLKAVPPADAPGIMSTHIKTLVGRYAGQMYSWDAIHEVINEQAPGPDYLRNTIWLKLLGPDYIQTAIRQIHDIDPGAILSYNEFGLEDDSPQAAAKRKAVLQLLDKLLEQKVPIGALALESHIGPELSFKTLPGFLAQVQMRGLKIFVSELDVRDLTLPGDIAKRDAAVAAVYKNYLDAVLQNSAVELVATWGLFDADSWMIKGRPRKDGLAVRPLPFDAQLQPTSAFDAIVQAFESRKA
jgi:endo-1,4-beta-xylanase